MFHVLSRALLPLELTRLSPPRFFISTFFFICKTPISKRNTQSTARVYHYNHLLLLPSTSPSSMSTTSPLQFKPTNNQFKLLGEHPIPPSQPTLHIHSSMITHAPSMLIHPLMIPFHPFHPFHPGSPLACSKYNLFFDKQGPEDLLFCLR